MILYENIFGLFDNEEYSFPNGVFYSKIDKEKEIEISSYNVVVLDETIFQLNNNLNSFLIDILNHPKYKENEFPFMNEKKIIKRNFFFTFLKQKEESFLKTVFKIIEEEYLVNIKSQHETNNENPIDFINRIRDQKGMKTAKKIYFNEIRKFYNLICVIQSPYINSLDLNHIKSDGIYSFFQDETGKTITKVRTYTYDCWMPKLDNLQNEIVQKLNESSEIPLQDLFMARSKIYLRHENYTMALLEAIISLEIVVPKVVNTFLQLNGASKDTISDFDHKFGLSVRVKAMLKVILPKTEHYIIDKVGNAIKLRNQIMHEGLTNEKIDKSIKINELIDACEELKELCIKTHEHLEKICKSK